MNNQREGKESIRWKGPLKAYVGITLEDVHYRLAQKRLNLGSWKTKNLFEIHCADAGRPNSWSSKVRNSVSLACHSDDKKGDHENWVLALDTLIHFEPTRWPVINYANKDLRASLMAYDLCIAENLSLRQHIILRLLAFFGQIPFANWVTIEEYRERLVTAGYAREKIRILDISEYVFRPLAAFLEEREIELNQYGLSIGRFRYAAWMFGWWQRTGVVRGCIIVARK